MFELVKATRYVRAMTNGKSRPLLLGVTAETQHGEIEVVAKFSAKLERGAAALAVEAISCFLAVDLRLFMPQPYLVSLDSEFISSIPNEDIQEQVRNSLTPTFATKTLPAGYSVVSSDEAVRPEQLGTLASIFAFDAIIMNTDRQPENPNCQTNGTNIAIFDHDLTLSTGALGTIFQPYPWQVGSTASPEQTGRKHVFYDQLKGKSHDFTRFEQSWARITDDRLNQYRNALPDEWSAALPVVDEAIDYLRLARANISGCLDESRRILE